MEIRELLDRLGHRRTPEPPPDSSTETDESADEPRSSAPSPVITPTFPVW